VNLPIQLRSPLVRLARLSAAAFALLALFPAAASAASSAGAPSAERADRAQERVNREDEKAIRVQEREAARNARREREAGAAASETGSATSPSQPGAPSEPSSASAPKSQRGCRVSIEASSTRVTAGEAVTLSGALVCPTGTSAADQQLPIYAREGGTAADSFSPAATVTTEADGSFQLTSGPLRESTVFQVRDGRHRARVAVKVAPAVTISALPTAAQASSTSGQTHSRKRVRTTFTGTVTPAVSGALVALQLAYAATGERWHSVAYGHVAADGSYSIAHTFSTPGDVSVRAIVHLGAHYAAAASQALSYEVPQPQKGAGATVPFEGVSFSLVTAPAPATVQSRRQLTLSGTLTPAPAGQPVYLESEYTNGVRFHVIAVGSVGEECEYTITHTFERAGTAVLRVTAPADSQHQPSSSAPFTVSVVG
jgi:hypothetical protein